MSKAKKHRQDIFYNLQDAIHWPEDSHQHLEKVLDSLDAYLQARAPDAFTRKTKPKPATDTNPPNTLTLTFEKMDNPESGVYLVKLQNTRYRQVIVSGKFIYVAAAIGQGIYALPKSEACPEWLWAPLPKG